MAIPVYPSDLNDAEWAVLAPLIPTSKPHGRPRSADMRRITNGVFYVLRTGCAWRYLPRDYGPWQTVYYYFRQWRRDGTWIEIHARLRELARLHVGRDPTPSAAIIDSQSVKTLLGGLRGFDGNKKLVGVKRHILVESRRLPAQRGGARREYCGSQRRPMGARGCGRCFSAPAAYLGRARLHRHAGALVRWAAQEYGWTVQVVYPTDRQLKRYAPDVLADLSDGDGDGDGGAHTPGFHVIPRRWVVERTFSWLGRHRRLSKDYERLTSTEEAFIYLVGIRLLLTRLAPA